MSNRYRDFRFLTQALAGSLLVFIFLLTTGVEPGAACLFFLYLSAYTLPGGMVLLAAIRPDIQDKRVFFAYSLLLGSTLDAALFLALTALDAASLFRWLPVIWFAMPAASPVLRRRLARVMTTGRSRPGLGASWIVVATGTLVVGTLGVVARQVNPHIFVQGGFVQSILAGRPFRYLPILDWPLAYNYVAHAGLAAMHSVTALPLPLVLARFSPLMHFVIMLAVLAAFCRRHFRDDGLVASLTFFQVFWVSRLFAPVTLGLFVSAVAPAALLVVSTAMGISLYFYALDHLLRHSENPRTSKSPTIALAVLLFVGFGVRSSMLPVLLSALLFTAAVHLVLRRRWVLNWWAWVATALVVMVAGSAVFYRAGSSLSADKFLQLTWHPFAFFGANPRYLVAVWGRELGLPLLAAGALAFVVGLSLHAGFLSFGFYGELRRLSKRGASDLELLLLGTLLAGVAAVFLTETAGGSQVNFLHYGTIVFAMLGAVGVRRGLSRRSSFRRWSRVAQIAAIATLALFGLKVFEVVGLLSRSSHLLVERLQPPRLWTAYERPPAILDYLRQHGDRSMVVTTVPARFVPSLPFLLEGGAVQFVGEPKKMDRGFAWSGDPLFRTRGDILRRLNRAIQRDGVLSVEELENLQRTLAENQKLYALTLEPHRPSRAAALEELASEAGSVLYRLRSQD